MYYFKFIANSKCMLSIYFDEKGIDDTFSTKIYTFLMLFMKNNLIVDNPDYLEAIKFNFSIYGKPKTINLYQDLGYEYIKEDIFVKDTLVSFTMKHNYLLPIGVMYDLYKSFKYNNYDNSYYIFKNEINYSKSSLSTTFYNTSFIKRFCQCFNMFDYQEEAVLNVLKNKGGVLIAPCGSGKTRIGLVSALLYSFIYGGKILWITHTKTLLNQTKLAYQNLVNLFTTKMSTNNDLFTLDEKTEILARIDLGDNSIGQIASGKVQVGNTITFSLVQTLSKQNFDSYFLQNTFSSVVVDECHHCAGSLTKLNQFYKCVNSINCRFKLGLTATIERVDGLTKCIYYAFSGYHTYFEIDKKNVSNSELKCKTIKLSYHLSSLERESIIDSAGQIDKYKYDSVLNKSQLRLQYCIDTIFNLMIKNNRKIIFCSRNLDVVNSIYRGVVHKMINEFKSYKYNTKVGNANSNNQEGASLFEFDNSKIMIAKLTGGVRDIMREDALNKINENGSVLSSLLICATQQIVVEGFDCVYLDVAFSWRKISNKNVKTQLCGRAERECGGKKDCYYYYINDLVY